MTQNVAKTQHTPPMRSYTAVARVDNTSAMDVDIHRRRAFNIHRRCGIGIACPWSRFVASLVPKMVTFGMRNCYFSNKNLNLGARWFVVCVFVFWGSLFEGPTLDPLAPAQSKRSLYARVAP